jgi:chromosome segregation ATPase
MAALLTDFDAVALLERQLADLSGGGDGVDVQVELNEARRLVAERDEDIHSYEAQLNALEAERGNLHGKLVSTQAEVDQLRSTLAVGNDALTEMQIRTARAETDARQVPQLLSGLARGILEARLLASALADAESDAAGMTEDLTKQVSASSVSERGAADTALRAVQERANMEQFLAEERHQSARLRGSSQALEEKLANTSAMLADVRTQLISARETTERYAARIGTLEVQIQARDEAVIESRNAHASLKQMLAAAQQAVVAEARAGAKHETEALHLKARIEALEGEAALVKQAAALQAEDEAATRARAAELVHEQQEAARAVEGAHAAALRDAHAAKQSAEQTSQELAREMEGMRAALATARMRADSAAQTASNEHAAALHRLHDNLSRQMDELRGRLADVTTAASATTRRLAKAEAEARRLGNVERHAAVLEMQLGRAQADLQKKTEALERVLRRKGSIAGISMAAPLGTESDEALRGQVADATSARLTSDSSGGNANEMGMQAMMPPRPELPGHHPGVATGENEQENNAHATNARRNLLPIKPSIAIRSRDPSPMPGGALKARGPLVPQPAMPGEEDARGRRPASEQRRRSSLRTVPSRYASPHVRSAATSSSSITR